MVDLDAVVLGERGLAYLKSGSLDGSVLSLRALENIQKQGGGAVLAPLPPNTPASRALLFDAGGLTSRRALFAWLSDYLGEHGWSLVLEDLWVKPSDFAPRPTGAITFFHDQSVYHCPPNLSTDADALADAFKTARSFRVAGVVGPFAVPHLDKDRCLGAAGFEQLVQAATGVFVSAYDQESIVLLTCG